MDPSAKPRKRRKREADASDREWVKYEKSKTGGGGGGGNNTNSSQITTTSTEGPDGGARNRRKSKKDRNMVSQTEPSVDPDGMLFLEDDALAKAKEPIDRLRIDHDELDPDALEQKAVAMHVIPPREQQSIKTLALSGAQAHYNDIAMDLRRMNWYANANQKARPLYRVLDNGFMSIDNPNPEATIACLTRDLQTESRYLSHLRQSQPPKEPAAPGNKGDLSIAKLNMVNGVSYHSVNYNRRTPKDVEERMRQSAQSERMQKFFEFYAQDRIDVNVDFGSIPSDFPMFGQLQAQFGRKYQVHEAIVQDSAELVPKVDIEVVSREYIRKYRQRAPDTGEHSSTVELCSQGAQCIFASFSSDKRVGYVGQVFYTPLERKGQVKFRNHDRLCIDCLLYLWTTTHDRNVANEVAVDKPMNHFSVECRPGQYSPHVMLTVMENDRPTGISKHVPRFSCNNRQFVAMAQQYREGDKLHTVYTPFLAEVGMDFGPASVGRIQH